MNLISNNSITAVVLAGGQGSRMGGLDKGLLDYQGSPVISQILTALKPQVDRIIINANRNLSTYRQYKYSVISDNTNDFQGPLAGMLAGLESAQTDYILTLPCDGPFVPHNLARKMLATIEAGAEIAVAHDGDRFQPVYALIPRQLLSSLQNFLNLEQRKIMLWYRQHDMRACDFSQQLDTFVNLNTPKDLLLGNRQAGAAE